MKLRELFEAPGRTAVVAFGRLNPPTIGHAKLVDKIKSFPGDHFLFISHTQNSKDNPLSFDQKIRFAKASFKGIEIGAGDVRTPIAMMQKIESLGYTDVIYVAGSDRVQAFDQLFNKYNGKDYKFNNIKVVNAGERDPDADGAEGMSASKMRKAAVEGDFDSFKQGVANAQIATEMYDAIRDAMGVKNEQDVDEISLFKGTDNNSVKEQDPNKLKVLDWIAARADGKEHFLSFYRKGAAWSGKLVFIKPDEAKKFMAKVERNSDYMPQIKQALTNIATTGKLFDKLGVKYQIRNAE
jgi:hypothetical protein